MRGSNAGRDLNRSGAPHFTVQDEIRRDRRIRRAGKRRTARTAIRAFLTVLLCLLFGCALVGAILFASMRTEEIEISGNARYATEEILSATGLAPGDVLPLVSAGKVRDRILEAFPYIERVEIQKIYPHGIRVTVYESEAVYMTSVREKNVSLDAGLRVMDFEVPADGLVALTLPEIRTAVEGSKLVFSDDDAEAYITAALRDLSEGVKGRSFTSMDLSDRYNITAQIGDAVKICFGDYKDLEVKLRLCGEILSDAESMPAERLVLDVSEPSRASLRTDGEDEF